MFGEKKVNSTIVFLLIDFPLFSLTHTNTANTMLPKKRTRTDSEPGLGCSAMQEDMEAKRKMAKRLLEGDGVDKDEAKAVSLLEDCVAHGDADAMVMLAKCCALGCGMEHNAKRAEALVSDAAEKGNDDARILLQLINDWKGDESVDFDGL